MPSWLSSKPITLLLFSAEFTEWTSDNSNRAALVVVVVPFCPPPFPDGSHHVPESRMRTKTTRYPAVLQRVKRTILNLTRSLSLSLSLSPEIRSVVVAENEKVDDIQRRRCRNFYYLMSLSSPNKLQALVASAVRKDKEKQPQVQTGSCCALYERVVLVIVVVKARFSVDLNPTIFALQISYVTSPLSTTFTPLVPR